MALEEAALVASIVLERNAPSLVRQLLFLL